MIQSISLVTFRSELLFYAKVVNTKIKSRRSNQLESFSLDSLWALTSISSYLGGTSPVPEVSGESWSQRAKRHIPFGLSFTLGFSFLFPKSLTTRRSGTKSNRSSIRASIHKRKTSSSPNTNRSKQEIKQPFQKREQKHS